MEVLVGAALLCADGHYLQVTTAGTTLDANLAAMHLALHATDPSAQTRLLFRYFKQVSDEKTKAEIDGMVRATGGEQLPALCAQLNEQYGVDPLALLS